MKLEMIQQLKVAFFAVFFVVIPLGILLPLEVDELLVFVLKFFPVVSATHNLADQLTIIPIPKKVNVFRLFNLLLFFFVAQPFVVQIPKLVLQLMVSRQRPIQFLVQLLAFLVVKVLFQVFLSRNSPIFSILSLHLLNNFYLALPHIWLYFALQVPIQTFGKNSEFFAI